MGDFIKISWPPPHLWIVGTSRIHSQSLSDFLPDTKTGISIPDRLVSLVKVVKSISYLDSKFQLQEIFSRRDQIVHLPSDF